MYLQAPIQLFGLEGRYAHALYSAATKQKQLEAVEKELANFRDIVNKDVRFTTYITDPTIKRKEKTGGCVNTYICVCVR